MAGTERQPQRPPTASQLSRLYALSIAVVGDPGRAAEAVLATVASARATDELEDLLESVLIESVRRTDPSVGYPPVPDQLPTADTQIRSSAKQLDRDQWVALWHALTGVPSEQSHLRAAIDALEPQTDGAPVTEEDIP